MRSLLLPLALLAVAFPTPADAVLTPIGHVQDRVIQQAGRFCVIVHNLTRRDNLVYIGVAAGGTEHAGDGTNYDLIVVVAKPRVSPSSRYHCVVWGKAGSRSNTWKLRRFDRNM